MANEKDNVKPFGSTESTGSGASATPAKETGGSPQNFGSTRGASTDSAGSAAAPVKEAAKNIYDEARSTAAEAYGAATDKATTKLEEKKSDLSTGLVTVADSFRKVGENIHTQGAAQGVAGMAAKYTDTAAQKLERVADYFERKDLRQMTRDLESYARRNPAMFIGGAAILGFLAARFLKSGSNRTNRGFSSSQAAQSPRNLGSAPTNPGSTDFSTSPGRPSAGNNPL